MCLLKKIQCWLTEAVVTLESDEEVTDGTLVCSFSFAEVVEYKMFSVTMLSVELSVTLSSLVEILTVGFTEFSVVGKLVTDALLD